MNDTIFPLVGILILFIGLPWLVLHYVTQWRKAGSLQPDDEHMLEDVWRAAKRMERRLEALEAILDVEAPGWRKRHDVEGAP
jgi:phage shock protein B